MGLRLPILRKLFFSHFLAVVLVSGTVGTYFYISAAKSLIGNLQLRLRNSAAMVSQALDARQLEGIREPADVAKPAYQETLRLLREFRGANDDLAYLYLMRRDGNRVVFVIDSDDTSRQALPGREYSSVVPELTRGFDAPSVDKKISTDEWGSFMSGYSPIPNGGGRYLVGLDMRAGEVQRKLGQIRTAGLISLAFSILLALLFSRLLSWHLTVSIKLLIQRCKAIAEGHLGERLKLRTRDEMDDLITAFNTMSGSLEESREENRRAEVSLKQAKDDLEVRVVERTKELQDTNTQLLHEIAERKRVEAALAEAAQTDALTGLLNRRAIITGLQAEVSRYNRTQSPFSLMVCDIDHFKRVNDTYGHDVGDQVLKNVSDRLRKACRQHDLIARWGGEEFVVLLPETDLKGGMAAAEKLRDSMTADVFPAGVQDLDLTLSIGVTAYRPGQTLDDCVKDADTAMYQAKSLGRNRVEAGSS